MNLVDSVNTKDFPAFRTILLVLCFEIVFAGIVFLSAGRWDLPWFWLVIAIHAVGMFLNFLVMDPGLRRERFKPGPGKDRLMRIIGIPFVLGQLVLIGLDAGRYHWSGLLPSWLQLLALGIFVSGFALAIGAMQANRFFSPLVRLQSERGHQVITTGPYAWIRHPGYLGMLLSMCGSSVAMGSLWGLVPAFFFGILVLRRLLLEEAFLRSALDGYQSYSSRVRYRLIPGLF